MLTRETCLGDTQSIPKALWEIHWRSIRTTQWISEGALEMLWVSPRLLQWISQSALGKHWMSLRNVSLVNIGLGDSQDALVHL